MMHNFLDQSSKNDVNIQYWSAYLAVNQQIAQKVTEVKQDFPKLQVVWIHGDQLLMAPGYVRRAFNQANIGFYFHSPWPASAIFNTFQKRDEILKSILQSDLLGFHLYEYARNFCNSC